MNTNPVPTPKQCRCIHLAKCEAKVEGDVASGSTKLSGAAEEWERLGLRPVASSTEDNADVLATRRVQETLNDPGVHAVRFLVEEFRAGMLTAALSLAVRLLLLSLGEARCASSSGHSGIAGLQL